MDNIKSVPHEVWKPIEEVDGKYEVSNLGRIRNPNTGCIRKLAYKHGYTRININDQNGKELHRSVHRLVAQAFIPNPDNKPQVNHINGIHDDNRVENLEWVTPEENLQHALENNLQEKGVERAKRLGGSGYNRHDKSIAYLRNSERLTKEQYDYIVSVSEELGVSIYNIVKEYARLNGLGFQSEVDELKNRIDEIKNEKTELRKKHAAELDELKTQHKDELEKIKSSCIGYDNETFAIGNKRNYLTIIGYAYRRCNQNDKLLVCQCDCGNIKAVGTWQWKNGKVKSCGCKHDDLCREANPFDPQKQDWLYSCWTRNRKKPEWYEDWAEYESFYKWAIDSGYEFGKHLYRLDSDKPFYPDNCEWRLKNPRTSPPKSKKKTYLCNGENLTISEMSGKYNMLEATIRYRLKQGLSPSEAVNTPKCSNGRRSSKNTLK